ncbi:MAG: 30S ribosomal protein S17e [Candidatus Aenigmarchaeota archaeon]|nr:30S ribosomal protein S17e [Candidatus Aenigmarchaeota archaeon]
MGRIRTRLVKNISQELVEKYPKELSASFEKNKEFLREMIKSKKLRNKVAGYIVRIKKHGK